VGRHAGPSDQSESDHSFSLSHLLSTMTPNNSHDPSFAYAPSHPSLIPLVADKVSLPSLAGTVDLLSMLPPDIRQRYESPSQIVLSNPPVLPVVSSRKPSGVRMASQTEYIKLIKRMHSLGMVSFTTSPKVVNGVFGVPKDGGQIRLIINAIPANTQFQEPPKVELPTPDLLTHLSVHSNSSLYVAKVDLDNFYHRLRLPDWLCPYFALPSVPASEFGLGPIGTMIHPCCVTLPMGWSHSVYVAQMAHEHFINTHTSLSLSRRIMSNGPKDFNELTHQIYIDDLNLFGYDKDEVARAQDEYIKAVTDFGLIVKSSKVVKPCSTGVECLGLVVHGEKHTVGLSQAKLVSLCQLTADILSKGVCTGWFLSHLIGKWTWACLVFRPSLAIFGAVYRFIEKSGHVPFIIWPSVRRELNCLIGIAPLLFSQLDVNWYSKTMATDASMSGLGVVATSSVLDQVDSETISTQRWITIVSAPWRNPEHINVLEIRAVSTAIRWVLSHPHSICCRLHLLCDSSVTVGSISKGRSSSPILLRRLRTLSALLMASGLKLKLSWIPSELNPADGPSRRYEL
jgi:hypothetical protein